MISLSEQLDNYAIKSEYGLEEESSRVILIPIDSKQIPEIIHSNDIDCVMRIDPVTSSIYSIHIGNDVYKIPESIAKISRILGLNNENRKNWELSGRYNFRTNGFDSSAI